MSRQANAVPLLRLSQVTHKYGLVTALWKIDLEVFAGDFLAVFGPNGAGKSTLLRIIASLMKPTRGSLEFAGGDRGRAQIGYVSHQSLLYNEMTGLENLIFYARLYGLKEPRTRARQILANMGLEGAADQLVRGFSRGMKQRLTLARALLHEPRLLLLDEPYTGLDQHGSRLLTEVLRGLRREERTVILITHSLSEGLQLSNRIVILHRGDLVYQIRSEDIDRMSLEERYFELVGEGANSGVQVGGRVQASPTVPRP